MVKSKNCSKNFLVYLFVIGFISGFVSCSKDSEPTVFDKNDLIGNYEGTCNVSISSNNQTVSMTAKFISNDMQTLSATIGNDDTYQSIGIQISRTASEFKSYGDYATFKLDDININFSTTIPDFIKNIAGVNWDNMQSVVLTLSASKNPPKYVIASKNLQFTYTGDVVITEKNGDKTTKQITYAFVLNKK